MNAFSKPFRSIFARMKLWFQARQKEKQRIEHVVKTVEPKIRLASGYRKRLQKPIQICQAHCAAIAESIPGPIYLKDSDYDADPLLHAAFIGAIELEDLVHQQDIAQGSQEITGPDRFALLTMGHRETTIFGPKMQGNMVLRDARMKSVTFSDHKIVGLSSTLENARKKLEELCFEMILEGISKDLAAKRTNLAELRDHLERLRTMSDILSGGHGGQNIFGYSSHGDLEKIQKIEQELKESKNELVHARQGSETPGDWLQFVIDQLRSPEKILDVRRISMRLDWKNVLTEDSDEKANDILLAQCILPHESKRDAVFITYKYKKHK